VLLAKTRTFYLKWVSSAFIGFWAAFVLIIQIKSHWEMNTPIAVLGFFAASVVLIWTAHRLIFELAIHRAFQVTASRVKISVWFIAMLLFGAMIVAAYPAALPTLPGSPKLIIITTGQKNPLSQGNEVKLTKILGKGAVSINLNRLKTGNLWKRTDSGFSSSNREPYSKLTLENDPASSYTLFFSADNRSGKIKILWGGKEQVVDLYSEIEKPIILHLQQSRTMALLEFLYLFLLTVSLGCLLFIASVYLSTQNWSFARSAEPIRPLWALFYALPMMIAWTITLLIFWPGIMSYDSLSQWSQMLTGRYNDLHPAFHTLTNWLITRLWLSPTPIALAQIIALSLVLGWGLYLINKAGVPRKICLVALFFFVVSPINNMFAITLWKDVPYTISLLVISLAFFQVSITQGSWLRKPSSWIIIGVAAAFVSLYRHNGLPVMVASLLVLMGMYRSYWKSVSAAVLVFLLVVLFVQIPLYRAVEVDTRTGNWHVAARALHYLAAYQSRGISLGIEGESLAQELSPHGQELSYFCYLVDVTAFPLPMESVLKSVDRLTGILFPLVLKHPEIALQHFLCANSIIWEISQPSDGYLYPYDLSFYVKKGFYEFGDNVFKIEIRPILPNIQKHYIRYLGLTRIWFIWRPAIYFYLSFFLGIIYTIRQRSDKSFLFLIPLIFQTFFLLLATASQETRFQFPVFFFSVFCGALIFADNKPHRDGEKV